MLYSIAPYSYHNFVPYSYLFDVFICVCTYYIVYLTFRALDVKTFDYLEITYSSIII